MREEIYPGTCIHLQKPGDSKFHLWVVITEADANNMVVIVNLTTKRDGSDETVVLNSGDHPFIIRPTVVNYSDATIAPVNPLAEYVKKNGCDIDLDDEILEKIQDGIFVSKNVNPTIKEHCLKSISFKRS